MRILYLTLSLFILFNIGAACRTPPVIATACEAVAAGLVRCSNSGAMPGE